MPDPYPTRPPRAGDLKTEPPHHRGLFERLVDLLSPGPDSKDELMEALASAEQRELIEPESRVMLEGVLRMADMSAGDVMVAARRMDLLARAAEPGYPLGGSINKRDAAHPSFQASDLLV